MQSCCPATESEAKASSPIPVDPAGDHCYQSPTNRSGGVRWRRKRKEGSWVNLRMRFKFFVLFFASMIILYHRRFWSKAMRGVRVAVGSVNRDASRTAE